MFELYIYDDITDENEEVYIEDIEILPDEYVVGYKNTFRKLFDVKSITYFLGTSLNHFMEFYKVHPELLEDLVDVRLTIGGANIMKHFALTPYLTGLYISHCMDQGITKAIEIIDHMAINNESI